MEIRLVSCVGREWDVKLGYSRQLPLVQSRGSEKKELLMAALQWMLSLNIFKIAHYKISFSERISNKYEKTKNKTQILFVLFLEICGNMCDAYVFALFFYCSSTHAAWIWTLWIQEITWQWEIISKCRPQWTSSENDILYILYVWVFFTKTSCQVCCTTISIKYFCAAFC